MISDQQKEKPKQSVRTYRDLIVWQRAMDFAEKVYQLTKDFPKEETYGLKSQLRRASVSIPSNIAEGQARNGRKEFIQFLGIASGSLAEIQTQLVLCSRFKLITATQIDEMLNESEAVSKLLTGLLKSLSTDT